MLALFAGNVTSYLVEQKHQLLNQHATLDSIVTTDRVVLINDGCLDSFYHTEFTGD